MKLIGVDVGGTFTDVVLTNTADDSVRIHKVPSTPHDPSIAVMRGVLEICQREAVPPHEIEIVFHGTTVATNAVIENKGCRTGLITTEGFRDVVYIGRHQRPHHYSIKQDIPWQARPLVKRRHIKTVPERLVPPRGEVLKPLDEAAVRAAAAELKAEGVQAVAICFLFSYLNPEHERRAKAIVQEVCPDIFVTTSSETAPVFREFERFTTTLMNAYIGPLVRDYVASLDTALKQAGMRAELRIMSSNGGMATASMIATLPASTLMSGLAAGILGGAWVGALTGRRNVICLDIGGTSADIGVVRDGQLAEASARDTMVSGYPVVIPMIDLHTIGAGGGSIAHVDLGSFRVGPMSAGAVPGPAAYARGGTLPTVTDANVVLGRLDKDNFLGAAMQLDEVAADSTIQKLADELGIAKLDAAEGVINILNANMANAIRTMTVQKGIDPRQFALVASGGGGPLHGVEVARSLGMTEVIVPPFPGINSAIGLLTTDIKYDVVRTQFQTVAALDYIRLNADLTDMETVLRRQFERDGVAASGVRYERFADARYVGQGYELRIALASGEIDEVAIAAAAARFHDAHRQEYGHAFTDSPIELVNVRVRGIGPLAQIKQTAAHTDGSIDAALVRMSATTFRIDGRLEERQTAFYRKDKLPVGQQISGPAVIVQTDTTTLIPPDCTFVVQQSGAIIIRINDANTSV
ncbi:MAG: methylhydantoinase [Rhodospirillales bacterium]|nr:methylhydantoinase [Rhodospirillales bacterium]